MEKILLKEKIAAGFVVLVGTVVLLLIISGVWIGQTVKEQCIMAQGKYEGDCVQALISFLDDNTNSFRERNSAIWALGQMGDPRALPVLEKYYTGQIPPREPLDRSISQYELKKAINLAKGGTNITHFLWNPYKIR